jgi:ribosomal protein L14E/L6E/L27E
MGRLGEERSKAYVIVDIQNDKQVIVQSIYTVNRERVSLKQLILLDAVIEIKRDDNVDDVRKIIDS